jgi:hypothetical protein
MGAVASLMSTFGAVQLLLAVTALLLLLLLLTTTVTALLPIVVFAPGANVTKNPAGGNACRSSRACMGAKEQAVWGTFSRTCLLLHVGVNVQAAATKPPCPVSFVVAVPFTVATSVML